MRIRVLPYKQGSKSAKALSRELGGKVLRLENSRFKPRPGDVVINWGNSQYPDFLYSTNFNCVPLRRVTNKLAFFQEFQHTGFLPKFWTTKESIPHEEFPIVCRTILSGHSGAGIRIASVPADLVDAPLYVKYEKKKDEYRVHLGRGSDGAGPHVISAQRKARRLSCESPDWQVRNHANGFVYSRDNFVLPTPCMDAAVKCFEKTGLDFGAVDVIYNEHNDKAYVLEINTAPGLEGTTVEDYAKFFLDKLA